MIAFTDAEEKRAREEAARKERERQEQERKDREAAEARRKQEEEQAKDETLDRPAAPVYVAPAPVQQSAPIQPEIRRTTFGQSGAAFTAKKVWDYELVDISLVPNEFVTLNESKVSAVVKAGISEIPGIRIFQKSTASVR
jgi:sRNA-binding protein